MEIAVLTYDCSDFLELLNKRYEKDKKLHLIRYRSQNLDMNAVKISHISDIDQIEMQYVFATITHGLYVLCNKEKEACPLLFMIIVICQIIHLEFNNQPCMNQYSSRVRH